MVCQDPFHSLEQERFSCGSCPTRCQRCPCEAMDNTHHISTAFPPHHGFLPTSPVISHISCALLLLFIGVCYPQENCSEHSCNWSQVIQVSPTCHAAECWPQVTLLTPSKATLSTPAPCQEHHIRTQMYSSGEVPFAAQKQLLNSLCAWYWSFEPGWSWQTWDVPEETKYDQMKQKHIKTSPFGSIPINLQAHHYPRPWECLQLRTAAPFAPPLLGLSWVTTINLSFARQGNDNK